VGINLPLLIAQIVNFIVVLFLLWLLLYKPVMALFDRRRERIASAMTEADRARESAAAERASFEQQLAEERRTSQDRLREAVARGEDAARRRLDEASAEAEQIVARARTEADQQRAQALAGLHEQIADLALAAAGKALGGGIDETRHRALIDRFLKEELGDLA
jgi:F-type H+-transporting ATPase subunit b